MTAENQEILATLKAAHEARPEALYNVPVVTALFDVDTKQVLLSYARQGTQVSAVVSPEDFSAFAELASAGRAA